MALKRGFRVDQPGEDVIMWQCDNCGYTDEDGTTFEEEVDEENPDEVVRYCPECGSDEVYQVEEDEIGDEEEFEDEEDEDEEEDDEDWDEDDEDYDEDDDLDEDESW